jgi:ribosomal-protein-alanine N-acetyltransferase
VTAAAREPSTALAGRRVVLRPLEPSDHAAWRDVRLRCREWLEPWEPLPDPGTPDPVKDVAAFRARCAAWSRQRHLDSAYPHGIFLRDGQLVGEINLSGIQRGPFQSGHVGYWVDRDLAGQRLVPEALVVILRFAFDELRLHRIEIAIIPRNERSHRVVEKLGVRREGIAERYLQIRGVWEDHVLYGMTVEEWEERGPQLLRTWVGT